MCHFALTKGSEANLAARSAVHLGEVKVAIGAVRNHRLTRLKTELRKLFGDKAQADASSVAAWDGTAVIHQAVSALGPNADGLAYVDFMKGKTFVSPRGKFMIDPVERDIIQDIDIRRVEKVDGKLANVVIGKVEMVKDPWKIDNPPKGN